MLLVDMNSPASKEDCESDFCLKDTQSQSCEITKLTISEAGWHNASYAPETSILQWLVEFYQSCIFFGICTALLETDRCGNESTR